MLDLVGERFFFSRSTICSDMGVEGQNSSRIADTSRMGPLIFSTAIEAFSTATLSLTISSQASLRLRLGGSRNFTALSGTGTKGSGLPSRLKAGVLSVLV